MTKNYNPEDYAISSHCSVPRVIRPGEYLYVFCRTFYIKALVTEVDFIHNYPDTTGERQSSIWKSWSLDGDNDTNDNLEGTIIYDILPWVDWPLGHAAYYGDDGFFTLEEARRTHGRFSKRKMHRRVRQYLRRTTKFITHTHKLAGGDGPKWPKIESYYRKIYI